MKIAFFGHFGRTNLGNESTLLTILRRIRDREPEVEYTCICTGPAIVGETYGIATMPCRAQVFRFLPDDMGLLRQIRRVLLAVPSEAYRWFQGVRTLRDFDAFVIPGTGLLTDAYGLLSWGPYDLFRWCMSAKIAGCKVLFVSVGAGPVYGRFARALIKSALYISDLRSYRDESSRRCLTSIGFPADKDSVRPDIVFSFPRVAKAEATAKTSNGRRVVGVGVMVSSGRYGTEISAGRSDRKYCAELRVLIHWLLENDYDVRLLIGDSSDRPIIEEFKAGLRKCLDGYDESRIRDDDATTVEDLLRQIEETDVVVGTRFHNVLLSVVAGKPVVAISFHHKVSSLMESLGLSHYCLDINELRGADLIARLLEAELNSTAIMRRMSEHVEKCCMELDQQYDLILRTIRGPEGKDNQSSSNELCCDLEQSRRSGPASSKGGARESATLSIPIRKPFASN